MLREAQNLKGCEVRAADGVTFDDDTWGVRYLVVGPGGPAAQAGTEAGGVITAVDSEGVAGAGDLLSALRRLEIRTRRSR
jgi:S1-C subfamily serine protease